MRTVGRTFKKTGKAGTRKPTKKEVMKFLKEKGIPFDETMSVDELVALTQKE